MGKPDISPAKLAARLKQSPSRAKVEDVIDAIMRRVGGIESFADQYVQDMDKAPKGSVTRARLLDGVLKMVQFAGKRESATPLDEMSDSELQEQIQQALEKVLITTPIVDLTKPAEDANGAPPS